MTRYVVPPRLAFVVPEEAPSAQVFLMQMPDGSPLLLTDTAAAIWILAADGEIDVPGAVGEAIGLDRESVADDVENYLADLMGRGLLLTAE